MWVGIKRPVSQDSKMQYKCDSYSITSEKPVFSVRVGAIYKFPCNTDGKQG